MHLSQRQNVGIGYRARYPRVYPRVHKVRKSLVVASIATLNAGLTCLQPIHDGQRFRFEQGLIQLGVRVIGVAVNMGTGLHGKRTLGFFEGRAA